MSGLSVPPAFGLLQLIQESSMKKLTLFAKASRETKLLAKMQEQNKDIIISVTRRARNRDPIFLDNVASL